MRQGKSLPILFLGTLLALAPTGGQAETARQSYLFYLHGAWIEQQGLAKAHPRFGFYRYHDIVRIFEKEGFVVRSELREVEIPMRSYAEKIASQIRNLLGQGVPPEKITVIGHSKGGHLSLLIASLVGEPRLNFVVMAGCGKRGTLFRKGYDRFLQNEASRMQGRILSLYDAADEAAGTCQEAFERAPGIQHEEINFHTGQGHGLFYSPQAIWMDEVVRWSRS